MSGTEVSKQGSSSAPNAASLLSTKTWSISVVVPIHNEQDNLVPLCDAVEGALEDIADFELVFVDDCSADGSREILHRLAREKGFVRVIRLAERRGQSIALGAGFERASKEFVVTMDGDLQNDPKDIPKLLAALDDADVVVGWREKRRDTWVRRISSRIANGVRNALTGESVRDTGCSLKVFRAEHIRRLKMFDGMHRFLPTLLKYEGYKVAEVPVSHHPRTRGKTKYGIRNRLFRSLRDLFAVRWMRQRYPRYLVAEDIGPGEGVRRV